METIKETEDEDEEIDTLIDNKDRIKSDIAIKTLEDIAKPGGLTRKSTFPRNFSTMSFLGSRKRKVSSESIMSSYSRLDFTGSSVHLQFEVNKLLNLLSPFIQ